MKIKTEAWNNNFKKWNGFAEDGTAYVFLGATYEIKDDIKALGGKWNPAIGAWIIDHKVNGYNLETISIEDIYRKDSDGKYDKAFENEEGIKKIVDRVADQRRAEIASKGIGYVGEIGQKLVVECILTDIKTFPSYFGGYTYKYFFEDANHNIIVWSTSTEFDADELEIGRWVLLRGTVKDHVEYKDVPQTLVTQCKIRI